LNSRHRQCQSSVLACSSDTHYGRSMGLSYRNSYIKTVYKEPDLLWLFMLLNKSVATVISTYISQKRVQ